jgi:hypothetical protein
MEMVWVIGMVEERIAWDEFQNGKNSPTPPLFSQEWQTQDLRDT